MNEKDKIIFFVWISNDVIKNWPFINNLSIKSAKLQNPDWKIILYLSHEIKDKEFCKCYYKYVDEIIYFNVKDYFYHKGNNLKHYAHQSDIFRLKKLIEHGGLYLDLDTITLNPFEPEFKDVTKSCIFSDFYGISNYIMFTPSNNIIGYEKLLENYYSIRTRGKDSYYNENLLYIFNKVYNDNKEHLYLFDYKENKRFFALENLNLRYKKNIKPNLDDILIHVYKIKIHSKDSNPVKKHILNKTNSLNSILKPLIE